MSKIVQVDVVIVGGGVAGLWTLHRLQQLGYSAILLEANTLGGGQTHMAQGIIHGGMKYALQGVMTAAAQTIADMPSVWNACLQGSGLIDLRRVPVLSPNQYLWSTGNVASTIAGFFSGLALKGNVKAMEKESFPAVFQHSDFKGHVYSLDEMVIDVNALVRELAAPFQGSILKIDSLNECDVNTIEIQSTSVEPIRITAQRFIFTAGSGNESLAEKLHYPDIKMQRRPLHMVVVKTDFSYPLYAHCLGLSAVPRMTITTHTAADGKMIWYLGGQIAEEGVKRNEQEQIHAARTELSALFPWLDFSTVPIASFFVDRAEALQANGKRPDSCYVKEVANKLIAWPTKLAFAPKLTEEVIEKFQRDSIHPAYSDMSALQHWPMPAFATPIWDQLL